MKALITGATSGIGKAIAQEMSRRGISLILTGRNEEALLRMQETLPVGIQLRLHERSQFIHTQQELRRHAAFLQQVQRLYSVLP